VTYVYTEGQYYISLKETGCVSVEWIQLAEDTATSNHEHGN